MRIRCPHCHNPIEVIDTTSLGEIECPSCGSSFSLVTDDATAAYREDAAAEAQRHDSRPKRRHIAHFELERELGVGAFGGVWLARDTKLDRRVAIKVPRKGALDAQETELFLRDARAAAQLKHPNIVGVHEVGRDGDTLYIVSDYVDGANLKEWLSGQRLSFRESAELVVKVAEALEHAHQAGVVHRDLKPGNIMLDRDGQPHVIDFGLAKRDAGEMTMTIDGHILGTPAYMSPEQARGKGHDADRRSDVYSLGVILFELLTGELPFRGQTQMLLLQIERDEPPRPRKLNARIPRDLETIALKCLGKEPDRRYASAQFLADDLRRWLHQQPILARPTGNIGRAWRWCRRNPAMALLAAGILLAMTLGTTASTYFAFRAAKEVRIARSERDRADKKTVEADSNARAARDAQIAADGEARRARLEAEKAKQAADFLANMFNASAAHRRNGIRFAGLDISGGRNVEDASTLTALTLLDRGAKKATEDLSQQPDLQAALMETIGNVYVALGLTEKAEPLLNAALTNRRRASPPSQLDIASSLFSLGTHLSLQLRFTEATVALREALAIRQRLLGPDHKDTVEAEFQLAFSLSWSGNAKEAESLMLHVLDARRKELGEDHPETAFAKIGLAGTRLYQGALQGVPKLLVEASTTLKKNPQTELLGAATSELYQAGLASELGQAQVAAALSTKAIDRFYELGMERHPLFVFAARFHVAYLVEAKRFDDAERFCRKRIEEFRRNRAPEGLPFARALTDLASVLGQKAKETKEPKDLGEAETLNAEALAIRKKFTVDSKPAVPEPAVK